jgi:hypothetical protein
VKELCRSEDDVLEEEAEERGCGKALAPGSLNAAPC